MVHVRVIESLGVDGRWRLDVAHVHGADAAAGVPHPNMRITSLGCMRR
jgi:hypothetical protein